jgi:hypothetical protein
MAAVETIADDFGPKIGRRFGFPSVREPLPTTGKEVHGTKQISNNFPENLLFRRNVRQNNKKCPEHEPSVNGT